MYGCTECWLACHSRQVAAPRPLWLGDGRELKARPWSGWLAPRAYDGIRAYAVPRLLGEGADNIPFVQVESSLTKANEERREKADVHADPVRQVPVSPSSGSLPVRAPVTVAAISVSHRPFSMPSIHSFGVPAAHVGFSSG